jgi:twitching motility protein PilT
VRYRVNVFTQRGQVGMVMRLIPPDVPPFERLNLPSVVLKLADEERGLILVTGITGSGKSTTLAAMLDAINSKRAAHIVTIEDPIEYAFRDKRSVVNQRELGFDTTSFSRALRAALRQDPDVILVGEMRDLETVEIAMVAAETGHLVLSTLHTVDAVETVNRIISIFPPHQQSQVRMQLAGILRGVISQRLVQRADGKGMVPAVEVLVQTARVRELVEDPVRTKELHDAIKEGRHPYGMVSFDQSLTELVQRRLVTYEEAVRQSTNPDDFALYFRGVSQSTDVDWNDPSLQYQKNAEPSQPARSATQPAPSARKSQPPPAAQRAPTRPPQTAQSAAAPTQADDHDDFQIERFGK